MRSSNSPRTCATALDGFALLPVPGAVLDIRDPGCEKPWLSTIPTAPKGLAVMAPIATARCHAFLSRVF